MGESGGLPRNHPDAGAPLPPEDNSSTRPSSSMAEDVDWSSANTSAKSPPCRSASESTRSSTGDIDHTASSLHCSALGGRRLLCHLSYRRGPHTGLSARIELQVTEADTAEAFHSGTVPVLATPRLMALCEEASCRPSTASCPGTAPRWPSGCSSTTWCRSGVGGTVWAEATLDRIEGRRLVFTLSVSESSGWSGAGKLIRVIVDRAAFLANVR